MTKINIQSPGGTSLEDGNLRIKDGLPIDGTLQTVSDVAANDSALQISTDKVKAESSEQCPLEVESTGTGGGIALLDNTTTDNSSVGVGALGDNLCFRSGGVPEGNMRLLDTGRLTIKNDTSATTQDTVVIAASEANSGIAIVPSGSGAITADIPDGTVTGGNARGTSVIDLQTERSNANQVASARNSVIVGGSQNRVDATSDYSSVLGGNGNAVVDAQNSVIGGGLQNQALSNYSTVSGGQSNTASTGTHATVVGGQSNTSSGSHSISGGQGNTASNFHSIAMGNTNTATDTQSISIGGQSNNVTERYSANLGGQSNAVNGRYNANLSGQNNIVGRFNSSGNIALAGFQNRVGNTAGSYGVAQGFRNTVNANYSGAFGRDNAVIGDSSYSFGTSNQINKGYTFAIGNGGASYMASMFSHGNGAGLDVPYSVSAQSSEVLATNQQTVTSGGTITLFLDGIVQTQTIQPNNKPLSSRTVYNTFAKWVAIVQSVTGTTDVAVGDIITSVQTFAWKDNVGVSSIIGSITTVSTSSDSGMSTASMTYTIGASQELVCTFTAPTFTGVGATVRFKVLNVLQFAEMSIQ